MRHLRSAFRAPLAVLLLVLLLIAGPAAGVDLQFAIFHPKTDAFSVPADKWT